METVAAAGRSAAQKLVEGTERTGSRCSRSLDSMPARAFQVSALRALMDQDDTRVEFVDLRGLHG
jgi:hypothetical protein